jgi:hypothetical protein
VDYRDKRNLMERLNILVINYGILLCYWLRGWCFSAYRICCVHKHQLIIWRSVSVYELVVCKVCFDLSEFKKYFEVYAWIKILGWGRKKKYGQLIRPRGCWAMMPSLWTNSNFFFFEVFHILYFDDCFLKCFLFRNISK